jgi:hypothetical protein
MFAKSTVSQSMIDAVNKVLGEEPVEQKDQLLSETAAIKEPTKTGMRVYGGSYGNSAKAKKDQTKSPVDNLKGPKDKEMKEELKGNQHKIDANHNNEIDAQDFKILKAKKKVKEGREFTEKLLETVRKSDVPAYLRKAKGDTPLTMADAKGPKKDTISAPENLAKARNEEVELDEEINEVLSKDASAGDYIHDFVHSDNPKFAGKSTAERKKMALGAYYGAQKEAYEASNAPITTDTLAGRMPGGKSNSFKSFKTRVKPLAKEAGETETPDTNSAEKTSARATIKAEEVQVEATIAGTSGWKEMKKDVTDKSGAVHSPMSRAKDLARQAFKTVSDKTKVKEPK